MKRPNPDAGSTGRDRKRAKMKQARNIQVEDEQGRLTASSSALPPSIDVDKFVQARAFELEALEQSMHSAKTAGNTRAFQSLPRHLRRRAASHNVQRLPLRLRAKARIEIGNDKLKHKRRKFRDIPWKKRRKLLHMTKQMILQRRAFKKGWLETHVWHAKRMKMIDKWGCRIAKTPTEKSFRSSYRASMHGCLFHDASYHTVFELKGTEPDLNLLLKQIVDPTDISPSSPRFIHGERMADISIYDGAAGKTSWPNHMIAPARLLWKPARPTERNLPRMVWIIVHPSAKKAVESRMKSTLAVKLFKTVSVSSLNNAVNMFEFSGPKANDIVSAILKPPHSLASEKAQFLKHLATSSLDSLPDGIVAGLTVHDPRLSFPPKLPNGNASGTGERPPIPSVALAHETLGLFQCAQRRPPTFSKADLDQRRASEGKDRKGHLTPTPEDDCVPILISKFSKKPTLFATDKNSPHASEIQGLTLFIPRGWAMPFLMSVAYCSPRIGGQDEIIQQHRESGIPYFPLDYAWTPIGQQSFKSDALGPIIQKWRRTPPAKRVNHRLNGSQDAMRNWLGIDFEGKQTKPLPQVPESIWRLKGHLLKSLLRQPTESLQARVLKAIQNRNIPHRLPLVALPAENSLVAISLRPIGAGVIDIHASLFDIASTPRVLTEDQKSDYRIDPLQVIGWVTSGGYSMARGQSFALGTVRYSALKTYQEDKPFKVLYKNFNSKQVQEAIVQVIL